MGDFSELTWVDDDGSGTVGTLADAAVMQRIEAGVKDAAQNSKQRDALGSRPAASSANKNWLWTDEITNDVYYSDGSTWTWVSGGAGWKQPVRAATGTNVNINAPGLAVGGISNLDDSRILLTAQTDPTENGIWILVNDGLSPMTRAPDCNESGDFTNGFMVRALGGYHAFSYIYTGVTGPTLGTDDLTFVKLDKQGADALSQWTLIHESPAFYTGAASGLLVPKIDGSMVALTGGGTTLAPSAIAPDIFTYKQFYGSGSGIPVGIKAEYRVDIEIISNATSYPGTLNLTGKLLPISAGTGNTGLLGLTIGAALGSGAALTIPASGGLGYQNGTAFSDTTNGHMILGAQWAGAGSTPSGGALEIVLRLLGRKIDDGLF